MTDRELMQQALEALERCVSTCFDQRAHEQVMSRPEHFVNQVITALRERLAQPEQEPVAWQWLDTGTFRKSLPASAEPGAWRALYTTPPRREWVGLTEEEIRSLNNWWPSYDDRTALMVLIRDAEAKLKEKNA